jgi:hypothetical protein
MADARQLRLDFERAFRPARAGCRKFFDELNDLGWDLQLQGKVEEKLRTEETTWVYIFWKIAATQSSYNTPVWEPAQVTWGGGLRTTYWGYGKTSTVIPTSVSP